MGIKWSKMERYGICPASLSKIIKNLVRYEITNY
jgi:hypothetical protein